MVELGRHVGNWSTEDQADAHCEDDGDNEAGIGYNCETETRTIQVEHTQNKGISFLHYSFEYIHLTLNCKRCREIATDTITSNSHAL